MMKKVFLIVMFLLGCGAMLKQSNAQGVNYVYDTIGPDIVACSGSVVTLARPLPPTNGYVYWCFWYVGDTNSNSYVLFDTVYSVAFAGVDVSVWLRIAVIDTTSGTSVVREVIWKRFQIHKEIIELRDTLVSCGSYLWHKPSGGTEVLTNSGDYRDTVSTALCSKQVHMLHLTIPTGDTIYYPDRWCLPGHRWKDTIFDDNQGQYLYNRDTIIGIAHCPVTDVIIVPDSNRFPLLNDIIEERACNSFDWWLNGQLRDHSEAIPNRDSTEIYRGPFRGDEINSDGCYKYYRLHLILKPIKHGIDTVVTCDSLLWQDNITYKNSTTTPTHTIERPFSAGCDSVVHLNLTINRSSTSEEYQSACDRYPWHDSVYTERGRYMFDDSSNAEGCTHTVWLNLEINHTVIGDTLRTSACDSYFWNGKPYSYREELDVINNIQDSHIYRNATLNGCDSIVYLVLSLGSSSYYDTSVFACEKYTWPRSGVEYNVPGVYEDSVENDSGCKDYYQLNLTINHIQEEIESVTECGNEYYWEVAGRTYTDSGIHEGPKDYEQCTQKMLYLTLLGIGKPPVQELELKELRGYDDCKMLIYPREEGFPEYFYKWQSNGVDIPGETKQFFKFKPSEQRGKRISVLVSGIEFGKLNMCYSESGPYHVPLFSSSVKVVAQPNPSRGKFSVMLTEEDDPVVEAVLYNAYGTKVTAVRASAGVAHFDEALQPGMYLVVVTTQRGKTYTDKVVVDY